MEQSKAMEYESRKASSDVLKPRNIYIYICMYMCVCLCIYVCIYLFIYFQRNLNNSAEPCLEDTGQIHAKSFPGG